MGRSVNGVIKWMIVPLLAAVAGARLVEPATAVPVAIGGAAALLYFYLYGLGIRAVEVLPDITKPLAVGASLIRLTLVALILLTTVRITGASPSVAAFSFLVAHAIMLIITQGAAARHFEVAGHSGVSPAAGDTPECPDGRSGY